MGPRADFTCLSPKCRQDGAATVYPDLPINSTRCPVCGSKRIKRLYNAINVASGEARARDRIVEPAYEQAIAARTAARDARTDKRAAPAIAVPMNRLAGTLASFGVTTAVDLKTKGRPVAAHPFRPIAARAPIPGPGTRVDPEGLTVPPMARTS